MRPAFGSRTYVVEGIQYILSFADPDKTKKVVINLSYGPTTGPHNGTAELESALKAFVAAIRRHSRKPKLEIVVAAGNSYFSDGHVVFQETTQPANVEWTWRLPPDNTGALLCRIWMEDR